MNESTTVEIFIQLETPQRRHAPDISTTVEIFIQLETPTLVQQYSLLLFFAFVTPNLAILFIFSPNFTVRPGVCNFFDSYKKSGYYKNIGLFIFCITITCFFACC